MTLVQFEYDIVQKIATLLRGPIAFSLANAKKNISDLIRMEGGQVPGIPFSRGPKTYGPQYFVPKISPVSGQSFSPPLPPSTPRSL